MEGTSSPFSTHRNWEEKGGGLGGLVGWGLAADEEEEDVVGLEREEARTVYCMEEEEEGPHEKFVGTKLPQRPGLQDKRKLSLLEE